MSVHHELIGRDTISACLLVRNMRKIFLIRRVFAKDSRTISVDWPSRKSHMGGVACRTLTP